MKELLIKKVFLIYLMILICLGSCSTHKKHPKSSGCDCPTFSPHKKR